MKSSLNLIKIKLKKIKLIKFFYKNIKNYPFYIKSKLKSFLRVNNPKVFVVGRNKTGTTSLKYVLKNLGYRIGDQRDAELLIDDWAVRDFDKIIDYCHSADAFQDVPFSYHYTFQALDAAFPGSKFILSIRSSSDEWYRSMIRFHSRRLEIRDGVRRVPTIDDIKNDPYVYKGYMWKERFLYGIQSLDEAYPKEEYISYYEMHNKIIYDYFRHRPEDLLIINLADDDSMKKLCNFLNITFNGQNMPKFNSSSDRL